MLPYSLYSIVGLATKASSKLAAMPPAEILDTEEQDDKSQQSHPNGSNTWELIDSDVLCPDLCRYLAPESWKNAQIIGKCESPW